MQYRQDSPAHMFSVFFFLRHVFALYSRQTLRDAANDKIYRLPFFVLVKGERRLWNKDQGIFYIASSHFLYHRLYECLFSFITFFQENFFHNWRVRYLLDFLFLLTVNNHESKCETVFAHDEKNCCEGAKQTFVVQYIS